MSEEQALEPVVVEMDLSIHDNASFINFVKERDMSILKLLKEDKRIESLLLLVKLWSRELDVCDARRGFFNAYTWVNSAIFFLRWKFSNAQIGHRDTPPKLSIPTFYSVTLIFQEFLLFIHNYLADKNWIYSFRNYALDVKTGEFARRQWRRSLAGCAVDIIDPIEIPLPGCAERNLAFSTSLVGVNQMTMRVKQSLSSFDTGLENALLKVVFQKEIDDVFREEVAET